MKNIIERILPNLSAENYNEDFQNLNIDSIDLVSMRVDIENKLGKMIPNFDWLSFKSLNDILKYAEKSGAQISEISVLKTIEKAVKKQNFINMPQMCLEALSENWLFKEAGSEHWDLLCDGLGTSSSELKDDIGNRLYATFVRIRIDGTGNLSEFRENDPYEFDAKLSRFGMGMFFSNTNFKSENKSIKIDMMTSFSVRKSTGDNKSLAKSQPTMETCNIPQVAEFPIFGNEYRLIKKRDLKTFFYKDYIFNISETELFSFKYSLNPYYDLNGVGLLYFASYPIINDFCELQYFGSLENEEKWEENYCTLFRDVMYYANCDSRDKIKYVLNSVDYLSDNKVKLCSTLFRESDGKMMAKLFTIKQKRTV
ncbi:Pnap_2097 family protein [Halpernia frigidisoli]|uniref:Probable biosynthetic protein, Pnap_2097 family n=1 Tax=Halpernia frigidisoli TaxID=1125876 RepID=A0A1I3GN60_9FLAO|nr:Pnap_2097 family protein [Halpernia frigidisoli]SFI24731.1 probable biosynthetic protein, Pnap_2097 family [Halpernia frigidisoli]